MLSELHVLRLRFQLRVTEDATLSPYKGDMLRRALLWYLGSMWCRRQPDRCREGCELPHDCLFGQLLEPPVDPAWSQPIRRLMGGTPPPLYVVWDMQDRRRTVRAGDPFAFELSLIGPAAIRQSPAFVAAMMVAAERGMGTERLKGRLERVDALAGPSGETRMLMTDGVWQGDPLEDYSVSLAHAQAWSEGLGSPESGPISRLQVRYLSPLKVQVRGKVAREPNFSALARAVVRRLRILSEVHGAGEWLQEAYGPLLDLAERVRLDYHETVWKQFPRYSKRGGWMPQEGLVGPAWYVSDADLRPLLPVLWLGQWVHAGKGEVWGNGRYQVQAD